MKAYLFLWIFICGILLPEPCKTSSQSTSTDSSFSNLVIDSSTEANFENLLETSHRNSSDVSSMNSANTVSSQSNPANEECNSTDCVKNVSTSSSSESLSSASKILWNRISTVKSTTQPSVIEENLGEESTVSSLYSPVTVHSSDLPKVHSTSFYSSDNELDSEINYDDDKPVHSDSELSNLIPDKSDNITFFSAESVIITEIMNKTGEQEKNVTFFSRDNETQTVMVTNLHNVSDATNATTVTPDNQDATGYTDDELDFTTYFINFSNSSDENIITKHSTEVNAHFYAENLTSETPFIESDASAEFSESNISISLDQNVTSDSKEPESKSIVTVIPSTLEFYKSHSTSAENPEDNTENSTFLYLESDSSFESEELKSTNSEITNAEEFKPTTLISSVSYDSPVITKLNVELSNKAITDVNSVNSVSTTESLVSDFQTNIFTESLGDNSSFEIHNNEKDDSIINQSMTTDQTLLEETPVHNSNESEGIDYFFNNEKNLLPESMIHTYITPDNSTVVKNFSEKSLGELLSQPIFTTIASTRSNDFELFINVSGTEEGTSSEISNIDINSTAGSFEKTDSSHLFDYDTLMQNTALNKSTSSPEFDNAEKSQFTTASTYPNRNYDYLSTIHDTFYAVSNDTNNLDEIHGDLPIIKTNQTNTSSDSEYVNTTSEIPVTLNSSVIASFTESNVEEVTSKQMLGVSTEVTENNSHEIEAMVTDSTVDKISTSDVSLGNETDIFEQTSRVSVVSSEKETKYELSTTDNVNKLLNNTNYMTPGLYSEKTETKTVDDIEKNSSVSESTATPSYSSISAMTERISDSSYIQPVITEYTEKIIHSEYTESTMRKEESVTQKPTTDEDESVSKTFSETDVVTSTNYLHTVPALTTHEIEIETASEISSLSFTETHREGKHIPFSSTLGQRTTQYPRIFNVTARTYSHPPQPETTRNNFDDLLYSQIRAEELSTEERSNLINAVVKFPDRHYSKNELNERIAVIHLWLLHVVADEYKNATLNLSGLNADKLDDIEFENLPQILYVFPTPEVFPPNITFTFVVHNKWRNETFPVDIILTILNLHCESLKKVLVDIEDIHFSHGLIVQKHDLLSVVIEKYGIILLATCIITVAMILLLICIVVYYRRKTRHSAHCLTDDKLHRNMQEAMGIDLNPAVIILQEEIREKAALNGNKICSLDDDEGWLAPINDVPVEDNNAPFVQDTKL